MEEAEDVYRFQELDSEDEKHGVMVDPGYQKTSNNHQFNPDELFFNDMDLRAWERRNGAIDETVYGDEYGYQEDEGFYDESGGAAMTAAEYEELIFQGVLDRIRLARATGEPDVQLTPEELDIYRSRLLRPRAPAVRPQAAAARTLSVPVSGTGVNPAMIHSNNIAGSTSGSTSTRSTKTKQRTSIFAPKPKKEKSNGNTRKRNSSNVSEATNVPPGFVVPGQSGQPIYAPINAYTGRMTRDPAVRLTGSPSQPGSRSASNSRQPQAPLRVTPPREVPGAFPSSPARSLRESTPPRVVRPSSSSSRQSSYDNADWQHSPDSRNRSSSAQQASRLVPFPVSEYQHYNAEPYQYQYAGQASPTQQSPQASSTQPQYARRVVSGPTDGNPVVMPRRVPVPVQRAPVPMANFQGSISDPTLGRRGSGLRGEMSDEDDGNGGILVDVIPQTDPKNLKVQAVKPSGKGGEHSSNGRDSEKKRRAGKSRRKN